MRYFYLLAFGVFIIALYFLNDYLKIIKKGQSKYLDFLLALLAISFTALVIFWFFQNIPNPFDFSDLGQDETKRSALGALGDYFGGLLNPVFAFLSFMGVLWTLKMSREELTETRKVMDGQLSTQLRQQFDSSFYELFSQLNKLQDQLLIEREREILTILKNANSLEGARATILRDRLISRYFMLLYQILKMINQKIDSFPSRYDPNSNAWKEEKEIDKKFYTNLMRSQQDIKILQLLFINCYKDFSEYKKYLKDAEFFEHMSFFDLKKSSYNFKLLLTIKFYVNEIELVKESIDYFGKSSYIKLLRETMLRKALFSSEIKDIDKLSYKTAYLKLIEFIFEKSKQRQINNGENYIRFQSCRFESDRINLLVNSGIKQDDYYFKGGQYFFELANAAIKQDFILEIFLKSIDVNDPEGIKQIKMNYIANAVQVDIEKNDGSSIINLYNYNTAKL